MSLLVGALVYALVVALIFGLAAASRWRDQAASDGEGAFLRRVHDGVVVGVGVLFVASLCAFLVPTAALTLLGAAGVRAPASPWLGATLMTVGAIAGAAYVGASHVRGGAVRGVAVLTFSAFVGVGTWLSPFVDLGAWRGAASVAAGVGAAVVAAAGLFARPRDP